MSIAGLNKCGLLLAILCWASVRPAYPALAPASEYQVKAAYLLNFTKFIEWPAAQSSSDSSSPFLVCIVGNDPFGKLLDEIIDGETLNGHKLEIRRATLQNSAGCQVVFFSKSAPPIPKGLVAPNSGVLLVGEGEDFLKQGGAIAFVIQNRRVQFDINQFAAQRSGLILSSRLLNVARTVSK